MGLEEMRIPSKFLILVAIVGTLWTVSAVAQVTVGSRSKKISFEDITVVGKIVKPQVQFIISREKGSTEEALELKESFLPKIMDSVKESPF